MIAFRYKKLPLGSVRADIQYDMDGLMNELGLKGWELVNTICDQGLVFGFFKQSFEIKLPFTKKFHNSSMNNNLQCDIDGFELLGEGQSETKIGLLQLSTAVDGKTLNVRIDGGSKHYVSGKTSEIHLTEVIKAGTKIAFCIPPNTRLTVKIFSLVK